jgi:hypothetical protein
MKNKILLLAFAILAFGMTSCIDLVEEVNINKNLSGSYEMRLETAGLGALMGQMGNMPEIPGMKEMDQKIQLLKSQPGISNVKNNIKVKDMKFQIAFDFADPRSLNNALYTIAGIKPSIFVKKFLKIKDNKIVRPNLSPYLQKLIEEQNLSGELPSDDLLDYINYKFIVNTPSPVESVTSDRAMIQDGKMKVITSYSFRELLIEENNVYLRINM